MKDIQEHAKGLPRILVACIGNIFLGDDSFGVEVAHRLQTRKTRSYPSNVQVVDFGIRGMDLAFTLLDDYEALVLVDAVPRGGAPGTLYLVEPDLRELDAVQTLDAGSAMPDSHSMDPVKVLAFARVLGARPIRTLLVGCEPSPFNEDTSEMQMGLSEPVGSAVDGAIQMLDTLIDDLLVVKHT